MAKDDNKRESAKNADLVEATVAAQPKVDLVKVKKHTETLDVHPTALAEHLAKGWKVAE